MGKIDKRKLMLMNSFRIFGGKVLAHTSPDILTKHNIKETGNKVSFGLLHLPLVFKTLFYTSV